MFYKNGNESIAKLTTKVKKINFNIDVFLSQKFGKIPKVGISRNTEFVSFREFYWFRSLTALVWGI